MLVYTTKFTKKKAILILLGLAVILCIIIVLASALGKTAAVSETSELYSDSINSQEDVVEYLNSLGWVVSDLPIEVQDIVIPRDFSDVFDEYNNLQLSQGFDLGKYKGMDAVRYTYTVLNYPENAENVVIDIVICNSTVIAGDVQSVSIDGFMHGLEYPTN